jgi:diguanylate cyclase (GGDEF)-like protein
MDYDKMKRICLHVRDLFYASLSDAYDRRKFKQRYGRTKTILRLLSNIRENVSHDEIYELISDMLLFLFNVDSVAFAVEHDTVIKPVYTAGRLKRHIDAFHLKKESWIIQKVSIEMRPLYIDSLVDLRGIGLSEPVESLYIFPVFSKNTVNKFLCLFNTRLSSEKEEEIFEICPYISFITAMLNIQTICQEKIEEMSVLDHATSGLNLLFDKPEALYNSIVDTAVGLSRAEKGSLMLSDESMKELRVKAVHGMNKWLMNDLKVMAGEGIAGKVFKESTPIVCRDIGQDFAILRKPKYKTPSFISIPLKVGEETIGVLNVSDKITGEVFNEEDLSLIISFANYASIALKGSNFYSLAEQMKELSITDDLTGLYNRRYFHQRLAEEVDRSNRYNLHCSLSIIDIDDFKLFNDSEGHPAGDEILKSLSMLIHDSLRAIDVLARIGGEEFAVIMPQTEKDEAYFVAERIRSSVAQKMEKTWQSYPKDRITVSVGVSSFPADGDNMKELIIYADKALYSAKMRGKNSTVVWRD